MRKFLLVLAAYLVLSGTAGASEAAPAGYVALTFDDGPSGEITEALLDGLNARDAKATFFLCGYRMEQYPSALPRYIAEGHEVGVHSTVHTDLTRLSPAEVHRDMKETAQQIFLTTGVRPTLMRPPGGAWDGTVQAEAAAEGMSLILWSVDPRDWAVTDADTVLQAMAGCAGDGDVILMHDLSESSVEAALRLVDRMQAEGYRFVTVSELAARAETALEPGQVFRRFPPPA